MVSSPRDERDPVTPDETFDAVVIGGGIIGCAAARALACEGVDVVLVERGTPGREATWAAAGMLAPFAEADDPGPFLGLALESLGAYPGFVSAIEDESGVRVGFRANGSFLAAFDEPRAGALYEEAEALADRGFEARWVDGEEAARLEPALRDDIAGALLAPADRQVENRALGRAAWIAATRRGAEIRTGTAAAEVEIRGGRVRGVRLADGGRLAAGCAVIAAGAWSGRILGLPREIPVSPVRGQMVALDAGAGIVHHMVHAPGCYLVPRSDGRLLVGATAEDAGYEAMPTAAGIAGLLQAAGHAIPSLAEAALLESWAGLRPGTPDELPILGPDPDVEGLIYATGHFRNGILLAPVTARIVADVAGGGEPESDLSPFGIERFGP